MASSKTPVKVTRKKITDYIPDDHNANKGSERGLQMIEDSLREDGAGRSIVADANGKIPGGNKTLEAALNAGYDEVIEVETNGNALIVHKRTDWNLDDPKGSARRYAYRDNRASQVSLNWDANIIAQDVESGVDLSHLFTEPELGYIFDPTSAGDDDLPPDHYSRKIEIPLYEPSGNKPEIEELYDDKRTVELIAHINAAKGLNEQERAFLRLAAQRHTVLHFGRIADLYAHSGAKIQRLMEESALVIIDYDKAVELGYVKLTRQIIEIIEAQGNE